MAHGLNSVLKRVKGEGKAGIGSRRIFAPHFKLQVLDSYRNDADCKGNQRATARKYGIHRRQIQKWLQVEGNLRSSVGKAARPPDAAAPPPPPPPPPQQPVVTTAAPLDFTTRARTPDPPAAAPMDLSLKRPVAAAAAPAAIASSDVWDLSTKPKPKPIKLFKPYLDDVDDAVPRKQPGGLPPCCTAACCYYANNNNNCDGATYTLHELQPSTAASATAYYYAFPAAYPEAAAPFYEDSPYVQPLKQRHSYSLDFKLSAIECYYQDSVCKGNQRAVATKYNIHRRQVQKWLKQEEELRQKNETVKHTQTVR